MDRMPALAGARTSLGELSARPTPRGASAGRGRLTVWLVVLGLVTLVGSVALASLSLHAQSSAANAAAAPPGKAERRAVAVAYVDVEGGIRSLYPGQAGRVVDLPVPEGGAAEKGEVLLQLDDALPKLQLKEAQLDLEGAKEKLRQAKDLPRKYAKQVEMQKAAVEAAIKQKAIARAKLKRVQDLFDKNLHGSAEDVEAARESVEAAAAAVRAEKVKQELAELMDSDGAIRAAEIEVKSKEEQVRKAELALRECRIVAPCKGKVIRRLVHVGEMLGASPSRPAVEFCPEGDLIVRAEVEQEFANKIVPEMTVSITDDVTSQGSWKGQVTRISEWFTQRRAVILEPMQYNDVRTLEVIIKVEPDPSQPLRINQRVRVKLEGEK